MRKIIIDVIFWVVDESECEITLRASKWGFIVMFCRLNHWSSRECFLIHAFRPQDWHFVTPTRHPFWLVSALRSPTPRSWTTCIRGMPRVPPAGHPPDGPAPPSPSRPRRGSSPNAGSPDAEARCVIFGTCGGTVSTRPLPTPLTRKNCPGIAEERASLHHDLTLLAGRTPRGPRRTLVRAYQRLLFHEPGIANRGQLWTGLWSPQHRTALGPALQLCSLKDGQRTLLMLATWATAGVQQLWRYFKEHLAAQEPFPSPPDSPGSTPALGHSPSSPAPSPGWTPVSPIPPSRRCLAHRPPPEPPPRFPQLSTPTTGPDSGPPRTPHRTPATKRPRSPSPLWTGQEEADHGWSRIISPRALEDDSCRIPGLAAMHNGGGYCLCRCRRSTCPACMPYMSACFYAQYPLNLVFINKKKWFMLLVLRFLLSSQINYDLTRSERYYVFLKHWLYCFCWCDSTSNFEIRAFEELSFK